MNYCRSWYRSVMAAIAVIAGLALTASPALAAGTASGTNIANNATLTYSVGSVTQPTVPATVSFVVDNKVNLTVVDVSGAHTPVAPGATGQQLLFRVTNNGNTAQDYTLAFANIATNATTTLGATLYTDKFNGNNCVIRVDLNNNSVLDAAENAVGTLATNIVNLAPDASQQVFVICDIPTVLSDPAVINGADAILSLTAETKNANTCGINNAATCTNLNTGTNTMAGVDVVLADITPGTDDAALDGRGSARDVYRVVAAVITMTKSVTAICDPVSGSTNAKAIPGAYVRYTLTISNAVGAGSATLSTITDTLPATLTFDGDFVKSTGVAAGAPAVCTGLETGGAIGRGFRLKCTNPTADKRACATNANGIFFTTAAGDDGMENAGANITINFASGPSPALPGETVGTTTWVAGEMKGGESLTIEYNAIIK